MDPALPDQLPPLDVVASFAFGGPMTVPAHACALLRAGAARAGWALVDASRLDLTAAAVGAHLWSVRFGPVAIAAMAAATRDRRQTTAGQATRAARRVLLRASGTPLWLPPVLQAGRLPRRFSGTSVPDHLVTVARWAEGQLERGELEPLATLVLEDLDTGDRELSRTAVTFARRMAAAAA